MGGGGGNLPALGEDGTTTALPGDIFDQTPCKRCKIRTKFADHVGDHVGPVPLRGCSVDIPGGGIVAPSPPPNR